MLTPVVGTCLPLASTPTCGVMRGAGRNWLHTHNEPAEYGAKQLSVLGARKWLRNWLGRLTAVDLPPFF